MQLPSPDEIRTWGIEKLEEMISDYLLQGKSLEDRLNKKLGEATGRILDSAMALFQVDTASLWYARDDFVTKKGQTTERIVFLDGRGEYQKLKDEKILNKIKKDKRLGEYPNYKLYPHSASDPTREKSGTGYVATYGTQLVTGDVIGIPLEAFQEEQGEEERKDKKGKYDEYIYGREAKNFDYVVIQPLIFDRKVIGVLKVEKRKEYIATPPDFFKDDPLLFKKLLNCLNLIAPSMARVLHEKRDLIHVMEYGSSGFGYAITLQVLDEHNITMKFVNEFEEWKKIFNEAKKELDKFLQKVIDSLKEEGKDLVVYRPESRIKTISSVVEKIMRHRNLNRDVTPENVFWKFKDFVGIRVIFRFIEDKVEFHKRLIEKLGEQSSKWNMADLNHLPSDEQKNPRDTEKEGDESGYRGIHVWGEWEVPEDILREAKIRTQQQRIKVIGEIQLRTLMEETWAQKTHPLVYKEKWRRVKEDVRNRARRLFKKQSDALHAMDETTEEIREMIIEAEGES